MNFSTLSTGLLKVEDGYINPHHIVAIDTNMDGHTAVHYSPTEDGNSSFLYTTDCNIDKFAKCAVKAMKTGEIIDVMA